MALFKIEFWVCQSVIQNEVSVVVFCRSGLKVSPVKKKKKLTFGNTPLPPPPQKKKKKSRRKVPILRIILFISKPTRGLEDKEVSLKSSLCASVRFVDETFS